MLPDFPAVSAETSVPASERSFNTAIVALYEFILYLCTRKAAEDVR